MERPATVPYWATGWSYFVDNGERLASFQMVVKYALLADLVI